jgi:AcrR family transcriptional regulator/RimJ/RimL family protein N-acetyltransferase
LSTPTDTRKRTRMSAAERREVIELAALDAFAERGYHGASIDEIARRSGVTPPVIYDHFDSKLGLHRRLLERTRDELLAMWQVELAGDDPPRERIPRALEAWARYVEEHPYAPRMFFTETTGDPDVRAIHLEIQAENRVALGAILGGEPGADRIAGSGDPEALEMAAEVIRSGLTGLAIWWVDHPEVPRERIVATAVNAVWVGLERAATAAAEERPPLSGERVLLRPAGEADVEPLAAILAEPDVARWWGERSPEWVRDELVADGDGWVIEVAGEVAGWLEAYVEPEPEYERVGLDLFLATRFHDQGYGTEVLRLAIAHFTARGHHRFTIDPAAGNERAIRAYAAVGFEPVGVMRGYEREADGSWRDGLLMDLLAGDEPA